MSAFTYSRSWFTQRSSLEMMTAGCGRSSRKGKRYISHCLTSQFCGLIEQRAYWILKLPPRRNSRGNIQAAALAQTQVTRAVRSEERRVGKEWSRESGEGA